MNFQELELKQTSQFNTVVLQNGKEVQVKKYIPIKDKIDLIQIALQKAKEDRIYNQMKLDVYFHLNIIYLYTNIEFSDEDKEDEMELYDILKSNNVIEDVICGMEEDEYEGLIDYLTIMQEDSLSYGNTAVAMVQSLIQDLPVRMAEVGEMLKDFDTSKYPQLMNFVMAANGGRDIRTNTVPFTPPATQ